MRTRKGVMKDKYGHKDYNNLMKEIIYILTNPAMPNYLKIGKTTNLEQRLRQLDGTSNPLPFQCIYAVEVENDLNIEKLLHNTFKDKRIRKNREFFEIDEESAISALTIAGGKDVTPQKDIVEDEDSQKALDIAIVKRERFNFEMIGIQPGTILEWARNDDLDTNYTAEVISKNKILFEDQKLSLSATAVLLLKREGLNWRSAHGPGYWLYKGEKLWEIRNRLESGDDG